MSNQSPRASFERAISLLKGGARQEAESLCRDMLERDPGDINFVSLLGSILATRGAQEEAVELLSRAVKAAPGHAKAREDLGTLLLNIDRAEEALPHLERARELRVIWERSSSLSEEEMLSRFWIIRLFRAFSIGRVSLMMNPR